MLSRISCVGQNETCASVPLQMHKEVMRHERNEQEDMKKGIEYLYEFKEKLSKLHPAVLDAIENMLQYRSNRY
jgi:hypothetical protein